MSIVTNVHKKKVCTYTMKLFAFEFLPEVLWIEEVFVFPHTWEVIRPPCSALNLKIFKRSSIFFYLVKTLYMRPQPPPSKRPKGGGRILHQGFWKTPPRVWRNSTQGFGKLYPGFLKTPPRARILNSYSPQII